MKILCRKQRKRFPLNRFFAVREMRQTRSLSPERIAERISVVGGEAGACPDPPVRQLNRGSSSKAGTTR